MLFRQLFDHDSSTYTYLLADLTTREAVLIDPVFEQFERDRRLIEELQLRLVYLLETHVHADHITGSALLREHFGAKTVVSERAGVVCPDWQVKHGDQIRFGAHALEVRETPGHTAGCLTYVCSARRLAFTGDALLIRGCGRTDFQEGDPSTLYRSVHEQIFTLPEDTTLFPAHDYRGRTATSVAEELRHNPRLGRDRSLPDFVQLMRELQLPPPRQLERSLRANVHCGAPAAASAQAHAESSDWAPIQHSSVGVPEVSGEFLLRPEADGNLLVDVREPDEFRGELGHVPGSVLVPLATLLDAARGWPKDRGVVLICRSGGRSGKATLQLSAAGFQRVASLQGGMRQWNALKLPVERGDDAARQG